MASEHHEATEEARQVIERFSRQRDPVMEERWQGGQRSYRLYLLSRVMPSDDESQWWDWFARLKTLTSRLGNFLTLGAESNKNSALDDIEVAVDRLWEETLKLLGWGSLEERSADEIRAHLRDVEIVEHRRRLADVDQKIEAALAVLDKFDSADLGGREDEMKKSLQSAGALWTTEADRLTTEYEERLEEIIARLQPRFVTAAGLGYRSVLHTRARRNLGASCAWLAVVVIAVLLVLFAIAGAWPFESFSELDGNDLLVSRVSAIGLGAGIASWAGARFADAMQVFRYYQDVTTRLDVAAAIGEAGPTNDHLVRAAETYLESGGLEDSDPKAGLSLTITGQAVGAVKDALGS